jgi:hypothetical protein
MSWFACPVRVGRKFIRASGENLFDVSRRSFGEGGRVRHSCSEGGAGLGVAASTPGSAVAKAIADTVELVLPKAQMNSRIYRNRGGRCRDTLVI